MSSGKAQPIIVIKKKSGHGGHHGGAWKVAYADFVTAMMSLFIVLWLMNSSDKIKKAVAGYFNDPKGTGSLLGTTMPGDGISVTQKDQNLKLLKEKIEEQIRQKKELEKLSKQIQITITAEGLRIEILEDKDGTFYESGSAHLSERGQELLALLAGELKSLPNGLLIEGHTDATPYSSDLSYSNWELSADRANAARRLMQQDGVRADQVTQVRGYADQMLRVKSNPYDASNRRISILVKNQDGTAPNLEQKGAPTQNVGQGGPVSSRYKATAGAQTAGAAPAPTSGGKAASPPQANAPPAGGRGVFSAVKGIFVKPKK